MVGKGFCSVSLLVLCFCGHSFALAVVDYSVAEASPEAAGYTLDWSYVYSYQDASAVAVDHYWLLTAAHVADDNRASTNLLIGGVTYVQQEIVFHASADLALVRYDQPFPGYYGLYEGEIYTGSRPRNRVYHELLVCGFGFDGFVSGSSFFQGGTRGIKRWGTNRGVGETVQHVNIGSATEVEEVRTRCFTTDFDLGDTDYEAGGNVYDSGGPVFLFSNGQWMLTGINLYRKGASSPYTGNHAAVVHDYVDWIKSVIPDYDSDQDGLPDWWEELYGAMERDGHSDLDGFTDYEEWVADTVPTDSESFLSMVVGSNLSEVIVQNSSPEREYRLEVKNDLMDASAGWQAVGAAFSGAEGQTMVILPELVSNHFFRVRAELKW